MLEIKGAVEAEWPDEGVAAHYGDPAREQRAMPPDRCWSTAPTGASSRSPARTG